MPTTSDIPHGQLREVFADFARLGERPGLGLSVPLGREDRKAALAQLADGERVLLVEPDNLRAEGTARVVESDGYRWWYGVLDGLDAIQDLDPDAMAARGQAAHQSASASATPE